MYNALYLYLDKIFFLAAAKTCNKPSDVGGGNFLGVLPHWWEYMSTFKFDALGQCVPNPSFPTSLFPVGLAVLDMLLRIAGFAAVIAIMISGIQYIAAQGNPEKAASARKSLYNALIGLGIAFTATLFVAFVGNRLTK